jgi:hypothetical protein
VCDGVLSSEEHTAYNRRLLFIAEHVKNDDEGDGDAISVSKSIICSNDTCGKEFSFDTANITEAPVGDWFCPICVGSSNKLCASSNNAPSTAPPPVADNVANIDQKRPRRAATLRVPYMGDSLVPEYNSRSK